MKYPESEEQLEEQFQELKQQAVAAIAPFDLADARAKFEEYIAQVDDMFTKAKDMIVNNDATNVDATALGTSAMTLFKRISTTKSKVPFYEDAKAYVDAVDSLAAMLTEKLYSTNKKRETIVSITKAKISAYAAVLEAERMRQEMMEREARAKLDKDLKAEFGDKAPKVEAPLISSKRDKTVRTETGTAYAVHSWEFEVLDRDLPSKVIDHILMLVTPDMGEVYQEAKRLDALMRFIVVMFEDTRIRKGIKDGIRNVEGLRIYEKTDTRFRT